MLTHSCQLVKNGAFSDVGVPCERHHSQVPTPLNRQTSVPRSFSGGPGCQPHQDPSCLCILHHYVIRIFRAQRDHRATAVIGHRISGGAFLQTISPVVSSLTTRAARPSGTRLSGIIFCSIFILHLFQDSGMYYPLLPYSAGGANATRDHGGNLYPFKISS